MQKETLDFLKSKAIINLNTLNKNHPKNKIIYNYIEKSDLTVDDFIDELNENDKKSLINLSLCYPVNVYDTRSVRPDWRKYLKNNIWNPLILANSFGVAPVWPSGSYTQSNISSLQLNTPVFINLSAADNLTRHTYFNSNNFCFGLQASAISGMNKFGILLQNQPFINNSNVFGEIINVVSSTIANTLIDSQASRVGQLSNYSACYLDLNTIITSGFDYTAYFATVQNGANFNANTFINRGDLLLPYVTTASINRSIVFIYDGTYVWIGLTTTDTITEYENLTQTKWIRTFKTNNVNEKIYFYFYLEKTSPLASFNFTVTTRNSSTFTPALFWPN